MPKNIKASNKNEKNMFELYERYKVNVFSPSYFPKIQKNKKI